jgi:uncharacterized membrane protein
MELYRSSERLETLTYILYIFTALLAIFTFSQLILSYNLGALETSISYSTIILVIGVFIAVCILWSIEKLERDSWKSDYFFINSKNLFLVCEPILSASM